MKDIRQVGLIHLSTKLNIDSDRKTYSVTNDKILAFDRSSGRPWEGGSRLDKLRRLTFDFSVFLDTFQGDLDANKKPKKECIKFPVAMSYHGLFKPDKSSNLKAIRHLK